MPKAAAATRFASSCMPTAAEASAVPDKDESRHDGQPEGACREAREHHAGISGGRGRGSESSRPSSSSLAQRLASDTAKAATTTTSSANTELRNSMFAVMLPPRVNGR